MRLKELNVPMTDDFLEFVLNSLSVVFEQLKISSNAQGQKKSYG